MKKIAAVLTILVSFTMLSLAAYKVVPSPFLGDTSKFKKVKDHKDLHIYRHPSKKSIDYKGFILDPVMIYQSANSQYDQISKEDIMSLSELFRTMIQNTFGDQIKVVDKPGPDVMRARFAIRGLKRGKYYMDASGVRTIQPDSKLAAATFEMEGIDSLTGERIVALVQNLGPENFDKIEKEELVVTVQNLFKNWVETLKSVFLSAQYQATIPQ